MSPEDRYQSLIEYYLYDAARKQGCQDADPLMVKEQIRQESNFNPKAQNLGRDLGLMQLSPSVYRELGIDPFNPEENIRVGCAHLLWCWSIFKAESGLERWKFALAAYNAGPGNIILAQKRAAEAEGPTDSWVFVATFLPEITGEKNSEITRSYVSEILSRWKGKGVG